jgi:hypothetical protein
VNTVLLQVMLNAASAFQMLPGDVITVTHGLNTVASVRMYKHVQVLGI